MGVEMCPHRIKIQTRRWGGERERGPRVWWEETGFAIDHTLVALNPRFPSLSGLELTKLLSLIL